MKKITLPDGRVTQQLGFGGSSLVGGVSAQSSRMLVEAALDAGFRHFDVAPSYGQGQAEDVLGDVLRSCHAEVTVATKAGMGRPRRSALRALVRAVAKPICMTIPPLWTFLADKARKSTATYGLFEPEEVQRSLGESLRRLRRDRIDLYLMHEIRVSDVTSELIDVLEAARARGLVGSIGTGTSHEEAAKIAVCAPRLGRVRQVAWSVIDTPLVALPEIFTVTHGAVRRSFAPLVRWLKEHADQERHWSATLGRDLADRAVLADLLLAAALNENSTGLVLISSQRRDRIQRAAQVANDPILIADGAKFRDLVTSAFAQSIQRVERMPALLSPAPFARPL